MRKLQDLPLLTRNADVLGRYWGRVFATRGLLQGQLAPPARLRAVSVVPSYPPDLTSRSSLSTDGDGTLDLGLPGKEHSEPASKESSWLISSSSRTHLWQMLCWQGRMRGWVKSSLQLGQISSRSMFLMGTWRRRRTVTATRQDALQNWSREGFNAHKLHVWQRGRSCLWLLRQ